MIQANLTSMRKTMLGPFTAIFENRGKWIIGYVEELPGANTQGKTLEEARENLKEAILMIIHSYRKEAEKGLKGKKVIKEKLSVPA